MQNKYYSLIAIFLSCFGSTYLSYIFSYAFAVIHREQADDSLSAFQISVVNVLWPSLIAALLALFFCWLAYRKKQGLRLLAAVLSVIVLLITLFFQQVLALALVIAG